jgi:aminoglycoside/choline kinase family phosphotransferase
LTKVLRSEGVLEAERAVTAFEGKLVDSDVAGMTSVTTFLTLRFDGNTACPSTMVCKMPGPNFEMKILMKLAGMVKAEVGFLKMQSNASTRSNLRVPRLFHAHYNTKTEHFLILMEDLRPARPGRQLEGCEMGRTKQAISLLARLHGAHWENYKASLAWTQLPNHKKRAFVPFVVKHAWPSFYKWAEPHAASGQLPDLSSATRIFEETRASPKALLDQLAKPPLTVIHGDCHSENYLWPADGSEAFLIDWQLSIVGQAAFDVANFVLLSLDVADLAVLEGEILAWYHAELANQLLARGQPAFSLEELKQRYVAGCCYTLLLESVGQGTMSAAELADAQLQAKRLVIFKRIISALNRHTTASLFWDKAADESHAANRCHAAEKTNVASVADTGKPLLS